MDYKLFDDFITLQALLKELNIIQSGGAAKVFLAEYHVFFNGEKEERRGKKIRIGDNIDIPQLGINIAIRQPSDSDLQLHLEEKAEKERVVKLVKELNKQKNKKEGPAALKKTNQEKQTRKPVRFPGT